MFNNDKLRKSNCVINAGDCCEVMQTWEANSVQLMVADPQHNNGTLYDHKGPNRDDDLDIEEYLDDTALWVREATRVLTPTGVLCVVLPPKLLGLVQALIQRELYSALHLYYLDTIIWGYGFGQCKNKGYGYTPAHTDILMFTKAPDTKKLIFNREALLVPTYRDVIGDKRGSGKGNIPTNMWVLSYPELRAEFSGMHNVMYIARLTGNGDEQVKVLLPSGADSKEKATPNQLPMMLLDRLIVGHTNPGQLVADPFSGSGTTASVSVLTRRHFVGCDLSPTYVDVAERRVLRDIAYWEEWKRTGKQPKRMK